MSSKKLLSMAKKAARAQQAQERRRIAEANRLERQIIANEKKRIAEAKREIKAQEKKEKAQYIENNQVKANNLTFKSQLLLESMETILDDALSIEYTIDFDSAKNTDEFLINKPEKPPSPPRPIYQDLPPKPDQNDEKYVPKFGVFDFSKKREKIKRKAIEKFQEDNNNWEQEKQEIIETNKQLKLEYESELKKNEDNYQKRLEDWEKKKEEFLREQKISNKLHEARKENYYKCEPEAINHYSRNVLSNSKYHHTFPREFELEYNPENKILIIEYQLPAVDDIPTLKEVKYIKTRDEFTEKHITKTQLNKIYDKILYQITLRTIYELYESHQTDLIGSIVFNGHVNSIDPATGQEINPCILSVQANKNDFEEINLAMVEPKACFKKLKGVGSSKLHSLTPIPPLVKMDRDDSRFTDSYDVIDGMDEGYNLAAMDWEDFEHLIRELFERAFAEAGGEVKVTQASRDGGIDAVIFDPDPLRGGKIVVQAKRYTNVVGVSAVRDLYGTLLNEGANKGILVTTSDYGPDAYKFASDKPIQLLNGGNLLHLLEQYGYKARIDLKEAKKTLSTEYR